MYQEEEKTISIGDMLAYVLHHWKAVLITSLVLTVCVGGGMSFKEYKANQSKLEEASYNSLVSNLTAEQLKKVDQFYNQYVTYMGSMDVNRSYVSNSILMRLDPSHISELTRQYLITTSYSGVYSGIMESFVSSAIDNEDYVEMAAVIGDEIDPRYVNELISINGNSEKDKDTKETKDKSAVDVVIDGSVENTYSNILTVTITYDDRKICEELVRVADQAIQEHLEKLKAAGVEVEMKELSESYVEKADSDLADYQKQKGQEGAAVVTDYNKYLDNAKSSMDEGEQALFDYLIQSNDPVKNHVSWKKWVVVGFAAGFVLSVVFFVVKYLMIPGIKTADDVYTISKEKEIGNVIQPVKSKVFLGALFHRMAKSIEFHGIEIVPDDDMIAIICDRIVKIAEGKSAGSVFIVSDVPAGYSKDVVDKCLKVLLESKIVAKSGNPSASIDALKNLRESDMAVMAYTNKGSLPTTIRSNLAVCEENSVPVIGSIMIYPQQ